MIKYQSHQNQWITCKSIWEEKRRMDVMKRSHIHLLEKLHSTSRLKSLLYLNAQINRNSVLLLIPWSRFYDDSRGVFISSFSLSTSLLSLPLFSLLSSPFLTSPNLFSSFSIPLFPFPPLFLLFLPPFLPFPSPFLPSPYVVSPASLPFLSPSRTPRTPVFYVCQRIKKNSFTI